MSEMATIEITLELKDPACIFIHVPKIVVTSKEEHSELFEKIISQSIQKHVTTVLFDFKNVGKQLSEAFINSLIEFKTKAQEICPNVQFFHLVGHGNISTQLGEISKQIDLEAQLKFLREGVRPITLKISE